MSVEVMTKVFYTTFPNLPFENQSGEKTQVSGVTAKIVMLAMADSSNEVGDNTFNGVERLATKTNLTVRSVVRATKALVVAGYLSEHDERSNYGTKSYMINLDMLGEKPATLKKRMGRPPGKQNKVLDSEEKVLDSEEKVLDAESCESSLSINKHHKQEQKKLHTSQASEVAKHSLPAKEDTSNMTTAEEHKRRTEEALRASYANANTGYTHEYPEDIRPVIERVEARWGLKAPPRPRGGKGKLYAYWIESCRALLDACAEFGVGSLDLLRDDFEAYMAGHGGVAPHTYSSPNSLVNSMLSKAAQLRSGNTAPMWGNKRGEQPARQTRLDV